MEDRGKVLKEYYALSDSEFEFMKTLARSPRENYFNPDFLKKLGKVNAIILRTMLGYDRYFEADKILSFLDPRGLKVLDFGCGVGDYGISMARGGANVVFCDFKDLTDFVEFRCSMEGLQCEVLVAPIEEEQLPSMGFDLAIFGEVLEHIPHPLKLLKSLSRVKYIYTSSFPYKHKSSFQEKGHSIEAFEEQASCLKHLESNYKCNTLRGSIKMWVS